MVPWYPIYLPCGSATEGPVRLPARTRCLAVSRLELSARARVAEWISMYAQNIITVGTEQLIDYVCN